MTSNQTYNAMIADVLDELAQEGVTNLCPSLERLFNELMKIEREQVLCAAPYERSDQRKKSLPNLSIVPASTPIRRNHLIAEFVDFSPILSLT